MPRIRITPEQVRQVAGQFAQAASQSQDMVARLTNAVNSMQPESGLINALTNAQPGQASVWACGGCPVSIRNITEALLTDDVERHTADGMERPANLSGMIPVFLIRHV